MPAETHFFSQFASGLLARRTFPLEGDALADEIRRFAALDSSRGLAVDVDAVTADLGGTCSGPYALFEALVRTSGRPRCGGRREDARAPAVVATAQARRPAASLRGGRPRPPGGGGLQSGHAVAGEGRMPAWGDNAIWPSPSSGPASRAGAASWRASSGPTGSSVLRYEDVVADPDAARQAPRPLPRPTPGDRPGPAPEGIVQEWEPWKTRRSGPVAPEHLDAGVTRSVPPGPQVAAVCRTGMHRFGYGDEAPSAADAAVTLARPRPPSDPALLALPPCLWRLPGAIGRRPL